MLIWEKRRLRKQYSQNKDPAVKTRINQLQKQVKEELRVETQTSWEKFWSLLPYFAHIVSVKFAHLHLLIMITEPACHHNSFSGSRCDSNHAPTISLKPYCFRSHFGYSLAHDTFHHTVYLITSNGHQVHFSAISAIFSPNSSFRLIPAETSLSRLSAQKYYKQPKVQIMSITQTTAQFKISVLTLSLPKY